MNTSNNHVFETGATTLAANNLVLTVLNDGDIYNTRKNCGFAALVGVNPTFNFKEMTQFEAKKQRLAGGKFTLSDIKQASELIKKETIEHCLELIKDEYNNETVYATGRRWWDGVNGNSYFSVNINLGKHSINIPFQYGYGNQWEQETKALLAKLEIKPTNIQFIDTGFKNKRDMFEGLYI